MSSENEVLLSIGFCISRAMPESTALDLARHCEQFAVSFALSSGLARTETLIAAGHPASGWRAAAAFKIHDVSTKAGYGNRRGTRLNRPPGARCQLTLGDDDPFRSEFFQRAARRHNNPKLAIATNITVPGSGTVATRNPRTFSESVGASLNRLDDNKWVDMLLQ
jgi:hypothetical protein